MLTVEGKKQIGNFIARLAVKVTGGFVGKQHIRSTIKGSRQRHSLLFAARKLCRKMIKTFTQP